MPDSGGKSHFRSVTFLKRKPSAGLSGAGNFGQKKTLFMKVLSAFHPTGFLLVALFAIGCGPQPSPLSAQPTLALVSKITGLANPVQVVNAGDGTGRLFVVQKGGIIKCYNSSYTFLSNFLTVTGILTSGEQGLLSLVFHPDYETNGFFWVYYVNSAGNLELSRFKVSNGDPNTADAASKQVVLTIPHPTNANHNGGELHFGPDGYLYLSTGDGGGGGDTPNNSQNTSVLLGKLLRINPSTGSSAPWYTVPAGNPFGNEVYCYGLRNPFRWSFDPLNGDLWIGDVGQNAWEEIDYRAAASINGTNFGWRCYEGNATYNTSGCGPMSSYTFPVYVYPTSGSSVIGGQVYRGTSYPAMQGMYVACDYYSGSFYKIISNGGGGWTTTVQTGLQVNVADFGVSEAGEMFVVVNATSTGAVLQLTGGSLPLELAEFTARLVGPTAELNWKTASATSLVLKSSFQPTAGATRPSARSRR